MFVSPFTLYPDQIEPVGKVTVHLGDAKGSSSFQLSPELLKALEPLATAANGREQEDVVVQGAPCRGIYIIRSGLVRLSIVVAEKNKEIFQRLLGPGCVVGLPAVLCSMPYMFTARCQSECTFAFIEAAVLQEFLRTQPLLCLEVVRLMGQELTEMNERRTNFDQCRECGCSFVDTCSHEMGKSE
jgi:CRP-like cAMP-binding protein